jgi:aspartate ammonia-lyase
MTEAEIAKVLSPERLSGVVPATGAIVLPMVAPEN